MTQLFNDIHQHQWDSVLANLKKMRLNAEQAGQVLYSAIRSAEHNPIPQLSDILTMCINAGARPEQIINANTKMGNIKIVRATDLMEIAIRYGCKQAVVAFMTQGQFEFTVLKKNGRSIPRRSSSQSGSLDYFQLLLKTIEIPNQLELLTTILELMNDKPEQRHDLLNHITQTGCPLIYEICDSAAQRQSTRMYEIAGIMLDYGADPTQAGCRSSAEIVHNYLTPLCALAYYHDAPTPVKEMLFLRLLNDYEYSQPMLDTMLLAAVSAGNPFCTYAFINKGANVMANVTTTLPKDPSGLIIRYCFDPRMNAETQDKLLEIMLPHVPDMNALVEFDYGRPLLYSAILNNNVLGVQRLLEHGSDPNFIDVDGYSLLQIAIYKNVDVDIVRLLVQFGADIHYTTEKTRTNVMYLLQEHPQYQDVIDNEEYTADAFSYQCLNGNEADIMKVLDKMPELAKKKASNHFTPLMVLACVGDFTERHKNITRRLLLEDAGIYEVSDSGATVFHIAAIFNNTEILEILAEESFVKHVNGLGCVDPIKGFGFGTRFDCEKADPIYVANIHNNPDALKVLLKIDIDSHRTVYEKIDRWPVFHAVTVYALDCLKLLYDDITPNFNPMQMDKLNKLLLIKYMKVRCRVKLTDQYKMLEELQSISNKRETFLQFHNRAQDMLFHLFESCDFTSDDFINTLLGYMFHDELIKYLPDLLKKLVNQGLKLPIDLELYEKLLSECKQNRYKSTINDLIHKLTSDFNYKVGNTKPFQVDLLQGERLPQQKRAQPTPAALPSNTTTIPRQIFFKPMADHHTVIPNWCGLSPKHPDVTAIEGAENCYLHVDSKALKEQGISEDLLNRFKSVRAKFDGKKLKPITETMTINVDMNGEIKSMTLSHELRVKHQGVHERLYLFGYTDEHSGARLYWAAKYWPALHTPDKAARLKESETVITVTTGVADERVESNLKP